MYSYVTILADISGNNELLKLWPDVQKEYPNRMKEKMIANKWIKGVGGEKRANK